MATTKRGENMLIDFEFSNFRSFRDTTKLTLEAVKAYKEREEENVFTVANQRFLKSAGIYGPNAGGKTNLVYAVAFMTSFVRNSASRQAGDPISITPFKPLKSIPYGGYPRIN